MRSFIWHPVYDIRVTSACAIFFLLAEALNRQVHSSIPTAKCNYPFQPYSTFANRTYPKKMIELENYIVKYVHLVL